MSLSCDCDFDGDWYHEKPEDYKIIDEDKKCCSCKETVKAGDLILQFECFEMDEDDEEQYREPWFMCERCGDIYYSLDELGFCLSISESMLDLLVEYHTEYLE